jgi:hypothetical protein
LFKCCNISLFYLQGPDYDDRRSSNISMDNKPRRLSLINGHRNSCNTVKFHSQGLITSSPTRCRTPNQQQPGVSPKHRLPPLQASPPSRDLNKRSSPTHILSLALSSPLKISHASPRMFGSNKIFKSEELASRYD